MRLFVIVILVASFLWSSVDINSASAKELTVLKGIGAIKAKAIVEYRKFNCFKSAEELVKVKGIGKKTLEKNLSEITVSECVK